MTSKHFAIERKTKKFTTAPSSGPHAKEECIPLQVVLRDVLKIASNALEVKQMLNKRYIKIDGRAITDPKFPVGLMDTVAIEKINQYYKIIPVNGRLTPAKIDAKEAESKIVRIAGKKTIKGGKFQLNFHDGRNMILSENDAKNYSVGDSIKISLPEQKIIGHIKLEKGVIGMIGTGKYAGTTGTIKDIVLIKGREPNKAVLDVDGAEVRTIKDYLFVTGQAEKGPSGSAGNTGHDKKNDTKEPKKEKAPKKAGGAE